MINIAKNIFVGYHTAASAAELPEATVVPCGASAGEKKRMHTIASTYKNSIEYTNKPLPGFTLLDSSRRSWGSADPTWQVIDPRGFIIRISSGNLAEILKVTGITEGLIQQRCVWARQDSQTTMTLVPVTASMYDDALRNTELIDSKIKMSDVQIGDTVYLQNELTGIYRGTLSLYGTCTSDIISHDTVHKVQTFPKRQIIEILPGKFHYQTNVKILSVLKKAESVTTREESAKYLNDAIKLPGAYFTTGSVLTGAYYGLHNKVYFASQETDTVNMVLEEISRTEADELFITASSTYDSYMLAFMDTKDKQYIIDMPHSSSAKLTTDMFPVRRITSINKDTLNLEAQPRRGHYGHAVSTPQFCMDNFVKYYKITKNVKKDSYI